MLRLSKPIILGSQSPRRSQLLRDAGIPFEVRLAEVEETWPEELAPEEVAPYLALKKAEAMRPGLQEGDILLTADSVVLLEGCIFNKPENFEEACFMLKALSGNMHRVITGVCLTSTQRQEVFFEVTRVFFAEMNEEEIQYYVGNFKPFDKAGSYAVQEWIGLCKIARVEGDFYNIIGLPVQAVYARLAAWSDTGY